jgi:hypothetical protein
MKAGILTDFKTLSTLRMEFITGAYGMLGCQFQAFRSLQPWRPYDESPLCEPSQKGGFLLCLQLQSQTFFFSVRVNFFGPRPVPLWEPSHMGW